MAEKGRLLTGARARFSVNGVKVGYATNVSWSETHNIFATEVLDNVEVEEQVVVGYNVELSASKFRIVGETLKSLGLFPAVGANTEEHLENILVSGDLSATIEDSRTGSLIATFEQIKIQSVNWQVDARGLVGENVTWACVRVKDESEV